MYFFISYVKKWLSIFRFAYFLHIVLKSKKEWAQPNFKSVKQDSNFAEKLYFAPSFFNLKFGQDEKLNSNQPLFLA